jgi:transcriptional antiterminator RfaH
MTRWYVVQTQPLAEAKAVWHLQNQGFRCFLPRIDAVRRHARRVMQVLAPLFPRYLFVQIDLDVERWRAINGTRGVAHLLTDGAACPLAVPSGVVEALLQKCDARGVVSLTAMGVFSKGAQVKIRSGAFAGQTAEVNGVFAGARDRVQVLLTLLGAEAELQLPCYAIEAA